MAAARNDLQPRRTELTSRPPPASHPLVRGFALAALCSALAVCWSQVRLRFGDRPSFVFLPWNLMLAWIPYLLSLAAQKISRRQRAHSWSLMPLAVVYLLFLPNAPYIVTDFVHLRVRLGVPFWIDAAMLFLYSGTGWMLGLLSLREWKAIIARRHGKHLGWGFVLVAAFLCGWGVWLGRVLRWNSWDVLRAPQAVFFDAIGELMKPRALAVSALFGILVFVSFVVLARLRSLRA